MKSQLFGALCACFLTLVSGVTSASPAKFNIPGDFPGIYNASVSDDGYGNITTYGTRLDFKLTTQNIFVPSAGSLPGYWTTTATPMVIDESSPDPWGDLNLVAGGIVPASHGQGDRNSNRRTSSLPRSVSGNSSGT